MLEDSRLAKAVEWASSAHRSSYADARYLERESETVTVKDGQIEGVDRAADRGVGVRVIADGAWGFAASDHASSGEELVALFQEAIRRAQASASVHQVPVVLAPQAPQRGEYRTPLSRDPFTVPIAQRVALLREADAILATPNAKVRRASIAAYRTKKRLVTSEGTDVRQDVVECGAGLNVTATTAGAAARTSCDCWDARMPIPRHSSASSYPNSTP